MAYNLYLILLLLSTVTVASASPVTARPSLLTISSEQQLLNIIEALIGAGDFGNWANVLSVTDPSTFPITATLFIPSDNASPEYDPLIFPYHIVPQQLTFSDLQLFPIGSRIPTLLPNRTILVTNNTISNYTIDNSPITRPDLYINGAIAAHGIGSLLNYSIFGGGIFEDLSPSYSSDAPGVNMPGGESESERSGRRRSDAPCLCTEFPVIFSVVCAVFAFKIHRNSPTR